MRNALLETDELLDDVATMLPTRDPDVLYEVVDGIEVELPAMSIESSAIANRLNEKIILYAIPRKLGHTFSEIMISLPLASERKRRPDLAFVTESRLPDDYEFSSRAAWEIVPELCVEVVSPTDIVLNLEEKLSEYFEAGVKQVWVIHPSSHRIYLYRSSLDVTILGPNDILTGGDVIPGFELPLRDLFRLKNNATSAT
jgi:Uma2 family endonuclease